MQIRLVAILFLLSISTVFGQKTIILKATPITKADFSKHLSVIDLISKPTTKIKLHGITNLKTARKTFVWKDDGEFFQYIYEGDLKDDPIAAIHEIETNSERYYLVNKLTSTIDTLLNRPIFYTDKKGAICLEGTGTDIDQRIQVGELKNNRFITNFYIKLARNPYIPQSYIFWYDRSTIFIATNDPSFTDTKFYKIELKKH